LSIISVKELTKYYGKNRGIIDVSFEVEKGSIFGFIGPNGAGKSTTIRTMLSFIRPTSGMVEIMGLDSLKNGKEIRKHTGYIPAEVNFYDDMKVSGLLKYAARLYGKINREKADNLCEIFELEKNKKIHSLSTGNKKKLAIVQALIHEPDLLIMDEPTGGLDPIMKNRFYEVIREERDRGATIFFSSHILSEVQRVCDKVAIIKEGSIIQISDIKNLSKTKYKKVKIEFKTREEAEKFQPTESKDIVVSDVIVEALFDGNIKDIMKMILNADPENVWIEEPDLEEIFMNYY
jgi:ABC-2 type transport system ATP-binding protein